MASGIQAKEECDKAFADLKAGKVKYITFKLTDDFKEIEVGSKLEVEKGKAIDNEKTYEEFVAEIKGTASDPDAPPQCRFGVFDFEFDKGEGIRKKICFFIWAPDNAKIKQKMTYASSKDNLRKKLEGVQVEVQCTDDSEIDYKEVLEKCTKASR